MTLATHVVNVHITAWDETEMINDCVYMYRHNTGVTSSFRLAHDYSKVSFDWDNQGRVSSALPFAFTAFVRKTISQLICTRLNISLALALGLSPICSKVCLLFYAAFQNVPVVFGSPSCLCSLHALPPPERQSLLCS